MCLCYYGGSLTRLDVVILTWQISNDKNKKDIDDKFMVQHTVCRLSLHCTQIHCNTTTAK